MKKIFPVLVLFILTGCQGYKVENGKWSFVQWNEGYGRMVLVAEDADQSSFKPINSDYAKDKNHVFLWNHVIDGADPTTFVYLKKNYSKDKSRVYYSAKPIEGADPNTFEIINAGLGKDKKDFYWLTSKLGVIDPASFTVINNQWAKDQKAYYAFSGFIKYIGKVDCDYSSMKIFNGYAVDKNRAYWEGVPIEGVDLNTFQEIDETSAKDRNRDYVLDQPKTKPKPRTGGSN
jgi:hypothetical protein